MRRVYPCLVWNIFTPLFTVGFELDGFVTALSAFLLMSHICSKLRFLIILKNYLLVTNWSLIGYWPDHDQTLWKTNWTLIIQERAWEISTFWGRRVTFSISLDVTLCNSLFMTMSLQISTRCMHRHGKYAKNVEDFASKCKNEANFWEAELPNGLHRVKM